MKIKPNQEFNAEKLEDYVKSKTTHIELFTHDFGHLKRVAIGAKWFVKILGGREKEQQLAYVAGLLHDIVRPSTELKDHAKESAEEAKQILQKFEMDAKDIEGVCEAIESHRAKHDWKTPLHQSVFLADKILEQMGAYVAFRRCMYVAECKDYCAFEGISKQFEKRMKKFTPDEFPKEFLKLAKTQFELVIKFVNAFKNKEHWALSIAKESYDNGKKHAKTIEEMIIEYKPISEEDKEYKRDALNYIEGRTFKEFEKLVN